MSKLQRLKVLMNQRLTAAAEEISGLLERTTAEYEQELSHRRRNVRQHKLLDVVFNPRVQFHTTVLPEDVPPESSPSLDQENPERKRRNSGPVSIKDSDSTRFSVPPAPVRSEDDAEKPQSSQLHQSQTEESREAEPPASSSAQLMETEADGEDCGGSEPARNSDPDSQSQPDSSETEDSDDSWKETRAPESGFNTHSQNNKVQVSDRRCNTGKKSVSCSECGATFGTRFNLQTHMRIHTGEKPFGCRVCGKMFTHQGNLQKHMRVHTGEKPFGCSVCGKMFTRRESLQRHMRVHTGEKPFGCSVCGTIFTQRENLQKHMMVHTGEKPFGCNVCGKMFTQRWNLQRHMRVHSGQKV